MEPKFSMTCYAIVVAVAGALASLMRAPTIPIICASSITVISGGLDLNYLRWRARARRHSALRASGRDDLDHYARGQWLATGPALLAASAILQATHVTPLDGAPLVARVFASCIAIGATVLLVSSHVDWFWILPRVSGVVTRGPCEMQSREHWTSITSVWLFHRLMAEIGVSAAVLAIPTYIAFAATGKGQIIAAVIAGFTAPAVALRERSALGAMNAGDPPVKVGEVIRVHHEVDEHDTWTWAYTVDVSLKGAKVVLLDENGRFAGDRFARKTDYLLVPNDTLRGARRNNDVPLCSDGDDGCCGVNWYCHNNCLAHTQSVPPVAGEADPVFPPVPAAPPRSDQA